MLWILGCIYFLNHCQVLVLDRQMNHFQGLDKQRRSGSVQCRRLWFNPWVRKLPWRREWLSTPVFLPGEFHGQRSLAGYSPWGHKESDTTELLTITLGGPQWRLHITASPYEGARVVKILWYRLQLDNLTKWNLNRGSMFLKFIFKPPIILWQTFSTEKILNYIMCFSLSKIEDAEYHLNFSSWLTKIDNNHWARLVNNGVPSEVNEVCRILFLCPFNGHRSLWFAGSCSCISWAFFLSLFIRACL